MVSILKLALALALALPLPLHARPRPHRRTSCGSPEVRKEWRTLSVDERMSYIAAVQCLLTKPAQTSTDDIPGVRNRYDDFVGTHIAQADDVHFVGIFYPYHRFLVRTYEKALQEECGYAGAQPYWDWTLDTADLKGSAIWDPTTGFGGNGAFVPGNLTNPVGNVTVLAPFPIPDRTGGGCIPDGPFAGLMANMGPAGSVAYAPHCVRRDFAPASFASMSGVANVTEAMAQSNYGWFDRLSELSIHAGGHWAVGGLYGTMTDKWASPSDPIFWLHHTNLDRVWWSWQMRDLKKREADISGPLVALDYTNTQGGNVTLDHGMHVGSTVNISAKVWDVMHIRKGMLCYDYDALY